MDCAAEALQRDPTLTRGQSSSWESPVSHRHHRLADQCASFRHQTPRQIVDARRDVGDVMKSAEAGDEIEGVVFEWPWVGGMGGHVPNRATPDVGDGKIPR